MLPLYHTSVNLSLLHLEHVLESILVKSVGASLPFLAPILVARSEEERTSEQVLKIPSILRDFFNLLVVLAPEVLSDLGIAVTDLNFAHDVHDDDWVLLATIASLSAIDLVAVPAEK